MVHTVAAVLQLQFMVRVVLHDKRLALLHYTFRKTRAAPSMAVCCTSLTLHFPSMLLRYCLNDFETVPIAPVITGTIFIFYIPHAFYCCGKVFIF